MKNPVEKLTTLKNIDFSSKERIIELETALQVALDTLKQWEDVSRKMLYPHQHNVGAINNETIKFIERVL